MVLPDSWLQMIVEAFVSLFRLLEMEFESLDGTKLQLEITSHNPGSVEIILKNLDYRVQLRSLAKRAFCLLFCIVLGQYLINIYFLVLILLGIWQFVIIYKCFMLLKERELLSIFFCVIFVFKSLLVNENNILHFSVTEVKSLDQNQEWSFQHYRSLLVFSVGQHKSFFSQFFSVPSQFPQDRQ